MVEATNHVIEAVVDRNLVIEVNDLVKATFEKLGYDKRLDCRLQLRGVY